MDSKNRKARNKIDRKMRIWTSKEMRLTRAVMHFPELVKKIIGDPDSADPAAKNENKSVMDNINLELKNFLFSLAAYLNEYPDDPIRALHSVEVKDTSVLLKAFVTVVKEKESPRYEEAKQLLRFDCEQAIKDFKPAGMLQRRGRI